MVPKLHKRGTSFKGAAAYLLHDKGRESTAERVVWAETHNLATDEPDLAWRIMAATAMDQDRLKEKAGVRKTGRKSKDHVLHLSLAWHPEEAAGLDREQMMVAARGALKAIGAKDRQAIIIAHDDEEQPHVHLLINRVSPEDGRILSSSKEKQNLSLWAEDYEKERGKVLCPNRVVNNAARKRGEYTRGENDKPRHVLEAERIASNDNSPTPELESIFKEQRSKDIVLIKKRTETKKRHLREIDALEGSFEARSTAIQDQTLKEANSAKWQIRKDFRDRWEEFHTRQETEQSAFKASEDTLLGRVTNAAKTFDLKGLLRSDERRKAISDAFGVFSSAGARLESFQRTQKLKKETLERKQAELEKRAALPHHQAGKEKLQELRQSYAQEHNDLTLRQTLENAALKAEWKNRRLERIHAFETVPTVSQDTTTRSREEIATDRSKELLRRYRFRRESAHDHER